jgi:hypothetical protein
MGKRLHLPRVRSQNSWILPSCFGPIRTNLADKCTVDLVRYYEHVPSPSCTGLVVLELRGGILEIAAACTVLAQILFRSVRLACRFRFP